MIVFPNAKINLGLRVLGKRADGFHDIETVFYPVPLFDVLEVIVKGGISNHQINSDFNDASAHPTISLVLKSGKSIEFSSSGLAIFGDPENNLCIKACQLFDEHFEIPGHLSIHLHKVIPMGAGLGGGSSDATFLLKLLNYLSGNPATVSELHELAAGLGSDCPFFIINSPVYATGRGEIMSPCDVSLNGYTIVIVKPKVHVSTKTAFDELHRGQAPYNLIQSLTFPAEKWETRVRNDFELSLAEKYPEILHIKNQMIQYGAIFTSLTGSGSALYGIFKEEVPGKSLFPGCLTRLLLATRVSQLMLLLWSFEFQISK